MICSLAFSKGKPCCKSKANKGKVSCKLNQANIDLNNDVIISEEESNLNQNSKKNCSSQSNLTSNQDKCNGCVKVPWWKFWTKKKICCNAKV